MFRRIKEFSRRLRQRVISRISRLRNRSGRHVGVQQVFEEPVATGINEQENLDLSLLSTRTNIGPESAPESSNDGVCNESSIATRLLSIMARPSGDSMEQSEDLVSNHIETCEESGSKVAFKAISSTGPLTSNATTVPLPPQFVHKLSSLTDSESESTEHHCGRMKAFEESMVKDRKEIVGDSSSACSLNVADLVQFFEEKGEKRNEEPDIEKPRCSGIDGTNGTEEQNAQGRNVRQLILLFEMKACQ